MTVRLPQNFTAVPASGRALDAFNHEVLAEKASSLGRAGRLLETALGRLRTKPAGAAIDDLVYEAAEAAQNFFIQRELCGLISHQAVVDDYAIPNEVMAKVGAIRRA